MKVVWGVVSGRDAGRLMLTRRRPEAAKPEYEDLLFRTQNGMPFVHICEEEKRQERLEREPREREVKGEPYEIRDTGIINKTDNIRNFTRRTVEAIGLDPKINFYGIRATFNTISRQTTPTVDPVLYRHIMGHSLRKEERAYMKTALVGDEVFERISNYLRDWFYADKWADDEKLSEHWEDDDDVVEHDDVSTIFCQSDNLAFSGI